MFSYCVHVSSICSYEFYIGNGEIIRLLVSRGARVDIAAPHGTPLHIAASYGNTSAVKILLDHHADVINGFHDFPLPFFDIMHFISSSVILMPF